jgi:hypothetical protein
MVQVVQAKCPYCKQLLRIPSSWLAQPMRCKHCRQTFQAKAPSATPLPVGRPALPAIKAPAPPAAIPLVYGKGKVVAARPISVPAPSAASNPFSFDEPQVASPFGSAQGEVPSSAYRGGRGRSGYGWLKGILIGACVLGAAGLVLAIFGEEILSHFNAPADDSAANKGERVAERKLETPKELGTILTKDQDKKTEKKPDPSKDKKTEKKPGPNADKKPTKDTIEEWPDPKKDKKPSSSTDKKPIPDKDKAPDPSKDKTTEKNPRDKPNKDGDKPPPPKDGTKPPKDGTPPPKDGTKPVPMPMPKPMPKGPEEFPRRALLVSVNNYLYANPLPYGTKANSTGDLADDLTRFLHFPKSQVVELSDGAKAGTAYPPVKQVIQQTITDFCAGSRPMDRVMLLFTGHAIDLNKEVYLVPMEGDLDDKETLVPFAFVVDNLVKCPARQKVLVLDVYRLDPSRGQERRGAGEMTEAFDAALKKIPADIQVWTSCSVKEQSFEFDGGSLFLEAFCNVLRQKGIKGIQQPVDPLPMSVLHSKVSEYVVSAVKDVNLKQTPQLLGKDPEKGAAYNSEAALATVVTIKPPPMFKDGIAGKQEIQSILNEIAALPPAKGAGALNATQLRFEAMPPFPAKLMEKYKDSANAKETPFIKAVRFAAQALRDHSESYKETIDGKTLPIPAPIKAQILKLQETAIGKPIYALQIEALDEMKKVEDDLVNQKPRWQAHFQYVKAKLLARIIYLREYSLMMGKIRKDELPALAPGNTGWRLASRLKIQSTDKEIKDMLSDYKKALKSLKTKHKGTPWDILAKREDGAYLGLEWKPNGRTAAN